MSKHTSNRARELTLLLDCAKAGDQESFATLLSRYSPLIESRLSRIRTANMTEQDVEDLRQEAYVSFHRALMHYDVEQHEVEFGLYAKICIDNGLYSAMRSMKHLSRAPLLPLDALEDRADEYPDPSEHLIEQEKFNALYAQIEAALSPWRTASGGCTSSVSRPPPSPPPSAKTKSPSTTPSTASAKSSAQRLGSEGEEGMRGRCPRAPAKQP
jgi:DNA-directed RNA polymerase specialized sigma24 family protein